MSNKLLKVNIQKELNEFDLNVDFELKNKRLGILGPSGCGKSMTLKSIAGIVDPDNGFISLTGDEETTYFDSSKKINLKPQKRNVGYLFQNYALFPNMTVEENVACGLSKEDDGKKVSEMIKRFHLEGLEKRYPRQAAGKSRPYRMERPLSCPVVRRPAAKGGLSKNNGVQSGCHIA